MADEAVVRIVLDGNVGATGASSSKTTSTGRTSAASTPTASEPFSSSIASTSQRAIRPELTGDESTSNFYSNRKDSEKLHEVEAKAAAQVAQKQLAARDKKEDILLRGARAELIVAQRRMEMEDQKIEASREQEAENEERWQKFLAADKESKEKERQKEEELNQLAAQAHLQVVKAQEELAHKKELEAEETWQAFMDELAEDERKKQRERELDELGAKAHLQVIKAQEELAESIRQQAIDNEPTTKALSHVYNRIEGEKQSTLNEEYYDLHRQQNFDPKQEAKKRAEREDREERERERQKQADLEYAKLGRPEFLYDPEEEAKKRKEAKDRSRHVDEAYKRLYPGDEEEDKAKTDKPKKIGRFIGDLLGHRAGHFARFAQQEGFSKTASIAGALPISAVGAIGSIAGAAANPSDAPSDALKGMGTAVSQVGNTLTMVNPVLGGLVVATGEATKSLGEFMDAVNATAKRYGEYSPEIAQGQAIAEITQTMGDFARAQKIGNEMNKFLVTQAQMQQRIEDIKIEALQKILPAATQILETMIAVENNTKAGEVIAGVLGNVAFHIGILVTSMARLVGIKQQEVNDNKMEFEDPTTAILAGTFLKRKGGDF